MNRVHADDRVSPQHWRCEDGSKHGLHAVADVVFQTDLLEKQRQKSLALKARDDNFIAYAQQLEQLAAEASAHAERLSAKVQEPKD